MAYYTIIYKLKTTSSSSLHVLLTIEENYEESENSHDLLKDMVKRLDEIPFDVYLRIFDFINVRDILSLRKVRVVYQHLF